MKDDNAIFQHTKALHPGELPRKRKPRDDDESIADQVIDALQRKAMGDRLDFYDQWLVDIGEG